LKQGALVAWLFELCKDLLAKSGLYSIYFLQRIQQAYMMGFYVLEHFKPLCFHYINKFNEFRVFFWAMNKISIQQLCKKSFMLQLSPQKTRS
jgi:hypothetical protein